ncbi:LOW QUALITY PROTEIN: sperm motility kinase X-like [Microtus ochrogaster]|uniref:non-specific serine/threonine protein kinase n=1 Tax=Microtus ochrogaster TaxID=79684 RepID=A0ABM1AYF0_MICOH|nr:LOW QUALITY PROTEIN: sperm motility kinase X-like [Microtus ochrogaster]
MTRKFPTSSFEGHTLAKDYYVMGTLGEGSLGKVKVALHLVTQTLVAIKILKKGTSTEPLINCEIELLKTLQHPHIVQLLQVIETKQKTYLVMEYAARGSLLKRVTECGHLEEDEARTLFRELTLAIKYIHSHNIAHRDIKSENILLDWEGHIKLSDFGLGKRFASGEKVKGFWGTTEYCAPEVFGLTEYEGLPTDIWSLGVVLYLLVTGPPIPRHRALQDKGTDSIPKLLDPTSPLPRASRPTKPINDSGPHTEAPHRGSHGTPVAAP